MGLHHVLETRVQPVGHVPPPARGHLHILTVCCLWLLDSRWFLGEPLVCGTGHAALPGTPSLPARSLLA